jgi:molecular chaperone HscB
MLDLSKNYFDLFGLPVAFRLNLADLSARYRELQRVVHPDRFAAADAHSQRLSLQNATLVNEAYETLRQPLTRAQYLLELRHIALDDEQHTLNDPAFLMQQMDLRERLAGIRNVPDPMVQLAELLEEIDARVRAQVAELAVLFDDRWDDRLGQAVQAVQKLQFLTKLLSDAEAAEADLEEAY